MTDKPKESETVTTNCSPPTAAPALTEDEIDSRLDWIQALCCEAIDIGGARYRAAERAVRSRIGDRALASCGHSYPLWDATAESSYVEGPTVTEYDDQALASALDVCAAWAST